MKLRKPIRRTSNRARVPVSASIVKILKIAVLVGIIIQTLVPPVLPISGDPLLFRVGGVALFTAGLVLAVSGRVQLGDNWLDIEDAGIRGGQTVVAAGVYRHVRHPIYGGDLLLLAGLELALQSWLVVGALALVPVVVRQAINEEHFLRGTLPGYAAYCERTKRFVPFVA
jgi:protein-S-isoprenylcysteine O-methyltransferase Ste14